MSNLAVLGDVNVQDDLDRISTRRHRSDVLAPLATKSKLSQAIKLDDARRGDLATCETRCRHREAHHVVEKHESPAEADAREDQIHPLQVQAPPARYA